jgi:hypothetical protein
VVVRGARRNRWRLGGLEVAHQVGGRLLDDMPLARTRRGVAPHPPPCPRRCLLVSSSGRQSPCYWETQLVLYPDWVQFVITGWLSVLIIC